MFSWISSFSMNFIFHTFHEFHIFMNLTMSIMFKSSFFMNFIVFMSVMIFH